MKNYQLPVVNTAQHKGLVSQAQYTVFFTAASCPGGTCAGEFSYTIGETAVICFGNTDAPTVGSQVTVNCEGTTQSFTLEITSMVPHTGNDRECAENAAAFDVIFESDLTSDCVLTHFITGKDECEKSCDA